MKDLIRSFWLSLPILLSYILYLFAYLFALCWFPVSALSIFVCCNLILWVGIFLWMEKVDEKKRISWREFGTILPLFCLEYSFVWKVTRRWGYELFEWPIGSVVDFINATYRKYGFPLFSDKPMAWDIFVPDLWTIHAISMGFFLFLLITVKIAVSYVNQKQGNC